MAAGGGRAAGRRLAEVLKGLRQHRRLRTAQVAHDMGLAHRSYEYFEAGRGRLNVARIEKFAQATHTDAFAILAALAFDSPEFAVRCADNKLMLILMMALQDFDAEAQADIAHLDPRTLIGTFTRTFCELRDAAARRDRFVESWLERDSTEEVDEGDDE